MGCLVRISGSFVFSLAAVISQSANSLAAPSGGSFHMRSFTESEDPLAFLEGSPDCDAVAQSIQQRYGKLFRQEKLSAILVEEYRHVSTETCRSSRFASCNFSWCGRTAVAAVQAPAVERVAVRVSAPVAESLIRPAAVVGLSMNDAEIKLAGLLKEKEQRIQQQVVAKRAEEAKLGLTWRQFSVPGAERPPRMKFIPPVKQESTAEARLNAPVAADQIGDISNQAPKQLPRGAQMTTAQARAGARVLPGQVVTDTQMVTGFDAQGIQVYGTKDTIAGKLRAGDPTLGRAQDKFFETFNKKAARARMGNSGMGN